MLKEMKLSGLVMDPVTNTPIIILKDLDDKNALPIWIGLLEASAIAVEMEKIHVPRPMTHDLVTNILDRLGAEVSRVEVIDLKNNTFYALIHLTMKGKTFKVDSRPSDAIAVALRTKTPIYVDEKVIEESKKMDLDSIKNADKESGAADLKDLLENMSPDDFKYKM